MICVCMLQESGRMVGFHAQGHAEFAEPGSDIVCSAVSALTQTAALGLTDLLHLEVALSIDPDGEMHCVLGQDCSEEQCEKADIILATLYLGLHSIQETYGECLKVTKKEV